MEQVSRDKERSRRIVKAKQDLRVRKSMNPKVNSGEWGPPAEISGRDNT